MAAVKTFARERPGLIHGEPALDGATLLHHAARFGQLNICKYLIGEGSDLAARDAGGYTPTHRACQQKNANVLRAVCTKAVVNLQGNYGETPLHFCAEDGNTEFGRILISEFNSDLNKFDWFGKTPLLVACYMERREFSKLLIENNADVNVQDKKKGNTALHYALDYPCDLVLADLLLKNGADPFIRNDNGKTSVDRAQTNEECKRLFAKFIKKR
jgi:ankyrin repeat protein